MRYERMETDEAVRAAVRLAVEEWGWAVALVADVAPAHNRMQQQLVAAFAGDGFAAMDESLALGIIAQMGETFETESGERATVGFGEVLVGAARLAANYELAIGPVLDLGRVFSQRGDIIPLNAQARLARAMNESDRCDVPEADKRARLVGALAMCVAKGLEDVELIHDVRVKPGELLVVYGREVLARLAAAAEVAP